MPVTPKRHRPIKNSLTIKTHRVSNENWGQGRGGRPWRRIRKLILERDNYLCKCDDCTRSGLITLADEVDHIIPLSQGGNDDMSNLRAINKYCHKKKTIQESKNRGGGSKVQS